VCQSHTLNSPRPTAKKGRATSRTCSTCNNEAGRGRRGRVPPAERAARSAARRRMCTPRGAARPCLRPGRGHGTARSLPSLRSRVLPPGQVSTIAHATAHAALNHARRSHHNVGIFTAQLTVWSRVLTRSRSVGHLPACPTPTVPRQCQVAQIVTDTPTNLVAIRTSKP
jgi:hypothetical protein